MAERSTETDQGQEELELPRLGVSWVQIAASAGASVTAAVVASAFGVTGTIIGTVVVSVVATAGGAMYNAWLHRTRVRLRRTRDRLIQQARVRPQPAITQPVGIPTGPLTTGDPPDSLPPARRRSWWSGWHGRPSLAVGFIAVLVTVVGVVSAVELIGQKPLGALVGPSHAKSGFTFFGGTSSSPTRPRVTTTTAPGRPGVTPSTTTTTAPTSSSSTGVVGSTTTVTTTITTTASTSSTTATRSSETTVAPGSTAVP